MQKKKLLFVIDSLNCAGAEKSLVTLLSLIDYTKYSVDLQLFSYGGEFEVFLPKEVNLLEPLAYTKYLEGKLPFTFKQFCSRIKYSISLRLCPNTHAAKARMYWKHISPCIEINPNQYDCAIAYAQCIPTFYVIDKVNAKKKLGWVNCIFHLEGIEKAYQERFYQSLDYIVTVSDSSYQHFTQVYPALKDKMEIIKDIVNPQFIEEMANFESSLMKEKETTKLLTVARLNKPQKGYDISLEACKLLKERGLDFKWYAIGRGEYRDEMIQFIEENHLQDTFILLGTTPNPYPTIKDCTLYVQTSRHEGFGLSIAEARILNRPVVTTEFDAVYNQMVQGKNGIVVPQDPIAVADAIERVLKDKELYDSIVAYQKQEKKGNTEEIEKFYELIK